jgi:hypothetical protein
MPGCEKPDRPRARCDIGLPIASLPIFPANELGMPAPVALPGVIGPAGRQLAVQVLLSKSCCPSLVVQILWSKSDVGPCIDNRCRGVLGSIARDDQYHLHRRRQRQSDHRQTTGGPQADLLALPHRPSFNMPATIALRAHATDLQPRPRSASDHALGRTVRRPCQAVGVRHLAVKRQHQHRRGHAGHARAVQQRSRCVASIPTHQSGCRLRAAQAVLPVGPARQVVTTSVAHASASKLQGELGLIWLERQALR